MIPWTNLMERLVRRFVSSPLTAVNPTYDLWPLVQSAQKKNKVWKEVAEIVSASGVCSS